jgi:hypothetical protein
MASRKIDALLFLVVLVCVAALPATAQSFRVQCPTSTITHPALTNDTSPAYTGPTTFTTLPTAQGGYQTPTANVNGAIKCQQISGGDGYATMGDGTQTYMFSFGPLSGLAAIAAGLPGTQPPGVFNTLYVPTASTTLQPGDPSTTVDTAVQACGANAACIQGAIAGFGFNGAVGQALDVAHLATIYDITEVTSPGKMVVVQLNAPSELKVGDHVVVSQTGTGYDSGPGTFYTVTGLGFPASAPGVTNQGFPANYVFTFNASVTGLPDVLGSTTATVATPPAIDGHVDPRQIMDIGAMNGNIPAPLMAIDEDDEFFLTLSNVGMIMRPDLFEQHTVHFHGYPNASSFYDGVPDASVAINIGASFTYYYLAPDAGTYFWHCHITPPEHLQMGMVGQLYVRPRQDRVAAGSSLYSALRQQNGIGPTPFAPKDLRTVCKPSVDILCSTNMPPADTGAVAAATIGNSAAGTTTAGYAYNDGDGTTYYDVEYPLQIHGFDPNFHFVGMTFNPEGFADMKDKYFLLNGRSYPDTVKAGPLETQSSDGTNHYSQPLPSIINIPAGKKALLRISDLDVSEYQTLASLGIPMKVIGYNAKLLRDQAGNNLYYNTNSITLAGGESLDVILDATGYTAGQVFYLYTPNLDHLSNDAENFGGLMTEVRIN